MAMFHEWPVLRPEQMAGWVRIPLLLGSMLIPLLLWLRRSLLETDDSLSRKHRPGTREIWSTVAANWRLVILGMMLSTEFNVVRRYRPSLMQFRPAFFAR
jgi:hypothetical protein